MDDTQIFNDVNQILWHGSTEVLNRLKTFGDVAVPGIVSRILEYATGHGGFIGRRHWWDGAKELCAVLSQIGTPTAQNALLTILNTGSSIVEFDQVRATAVQQLSTFQDNALELVQKLLEASKSPHAPLLQIQSTIAALGGQMELNPTLIIEKGIHMELLESIKYFGAFQKQAANWDKDQKRYFFVSFGAKVIAAFGRHGNKDMRVAEQLARPYFAAAILADPDPNTRGWEYFGKIDRTESNARSLAKQFPLPDTPPIP